MASSPKVENGAEMTLSDAKEALAAMKVALGKRRPVLVDLRNQSQIARRVSASWVRSRTGQRLGGAYRGSRERVVGNLSGPKLAEYANQLFTSETEPSLARRTRS